MAIDRVSRGDGVLARFATLSDRDVIDALPWAVIVTDPEGVILAWSKPAEKLYGWAASDVVGRAVADVLVPVEDRAQAAEIFGSVSAGAAWRGDFGVLHRDGDIVRAHVIEQPIFDDDGDVVAVIVSSEDVADRRLLEHQADTLAEHLALALDAGGFGTWRWDIATGETIWDAKLEALFGLEAGTFDATFDAYVALLHPDDADDVLAAVQRAVRDRTRYTVEHRVIWPDGSLHWLQGKGQVTVDLDGTVTGTMGCVGDVTEQMRAALERERAIEAALEAAERDRVSAQRLAFLGEINEALASAATRADVMRNVTRASVPALGDWCAIFVLADERATIPDFEIAHSDPAMVAYAKELQERFPYDPSAATGVPNVIRTGQSEFHPRIDDDVIAAADASDEARDIVRSMGLKSSISVPLRKAGRVLGALQFVNTESSRAYTSDDLALAQAVAGRISSTLENRRLAEHQRDIATTLQASLLPGTLPSIPGIDIGVRYWAAGEGTVVGGDFYDVFDVADGRFAAVIGDVCGTGPEAAALTGLARHSIRAAAWNGADPAGVLSQLNNAVYRTGQKTFCTALYIALQPTATGVRLDVAAGGHPLPIVCRADGRCETIGMPGTLLGLLPDATSTVVSAELGAGDTIVLYTDGITDVRPPHDLTAEAMEQIVARAATHAATADDVASNLGAAIDAALAFSARNDDIAVLVLKAVAAA